MRESQESTGPIVMDFPISSQSWSHENGNYFTLRTLPDSILLGCLLVKKKNSRKHWWLGEYETFMCSYGNKIIAFNHSLWKQHGRPSNFKYSITKWFYNCTVLHISKSNGINISNSYLNFQVHSEGRKTMQCEFVDGQKKKMWYTWRKYHSVLIKEGSLYWWKCEWTYGHCAK